MEDSPFFFSHTLFCFCVVNLDITLRLNCYLQFTKQHQSFVSKVIVVFLFLLSVR
jgi:hypothetical protein